MRDSDSLSYVIAVLLTAAMIMVLWVLATSPAPSGREIMCADRLGIMWSVENGVTERISQWEECVNG